MSTKSSVAWGDDFHFYTEMFDEDNVYLHLQNAQFYASPNAIEITIPRAVWEIIRDRASTDLGAAYWTDEQLALYAKGEADKQKRYNAEHRAECAECRDGDGCRLAFFYRNEQSEDELIRHWRTERTRQRAIADRVQAYKDGMQKK